MNFTAVEFLLFFPVILLLYWLFPVQLRWVLLLLASYLFYIDGNPPAVLLLLGTTAASYTAARCAVRTENAAVRRFWLALGVGVPLLCLGFFKYTGFLVSSSFSLLGAIGWSGSPPAVNILLPVGISFYTFQTLSYVLDVCRGRIQPERHFGYYALFVSFFPQLVAGPIERPENLLPQLKEERNLSAEDLRQGLWQLLRGFFKKLAVADVLAMAADPVFAAPELASGPAVALGTVCFALQIYCDFSGYSDIACGAARLMGIRLMRNFNHPYRAETIRDFWRCWHISLTGWFSDYVYQPLGGSRSGTAVHIRNILVVFLLSGLWHGANWTFLVWGGIHGVYQIAGILCRRFRPAEISAAGLLRGLRRLRTFALACFAWIFFRADSLGGAWTLVKGLFARWNLQGLASAWTLAGLNPLTAVELLAVLLCLWLLEQMPEELPPTRSEQEMVRRSFTAFLLILAIALSWLMLASGEEENAFLYFQF